MQIEGQDIEWIWDFLYLGHCFEANADCTKQDVKERCCGGVEENESEEDEPPSGMFS